MKDDKENNQEVNIETNNDAVLYSVMLSFLERKAKETNRDTHNLTIGVDEESKTIDVYSDINSKGEYGGEYLLEQVKVN